MNTLTFIPQGWSFFTRNPQEDDIYVYKVENNNLVDVTERLNSPVNLFGLKKINKYSGIELGSIVAKIKTSEWASCNVQLKYFNLDSLPTVHLKSNFPQPSFDGTYILQKKPPIPFLWAKHFKGEMHAKIVKVKVMPYNVDR
jgi:antimicrobial peptide system SdpA family protein